MQKNVTYSSYVHTVWFITHLMHLIHQNQGGRSMGGGPCLWPFYAFFFLSWTVLSFYLTQVWLIPASKKTVIS